jgi:hypothetical protein
VALVQGDECGFGEVSMTGCHSSQGTIFSWASLVCFSKTPTSLNPFSVTGVWPVLRLSGCLLISGEKLSWVVHGSEPITRN